MQSFKSGIGVCDKMSGLSGLSGLSAALRASSSNILLASSDNNIDVTLCGTLLILRVCVLTLF